MSVFPDSFTLEAAAAVVGGDALDVVDGLGRLVEKSLVVPVEGRTGTDRYQLLETLRQYGRDRLVDEGEAADRRNGLRAWAMTHVEELERVMRTPAQDAALAVARAERANLAGAMEWAAADGDLVAALRIASAAPIGLNSERRALIADLLDRAGDAVPPAVRAQANLTVANIALEQSDWAAGLAAARAAAAGFAEIGDRRHATWGKYFVVSCSWGAGDVETADRLGEEVLREFRALDDDFGTAYTVWIVGQLERDPAKAAVLAEEAEVRFRGLGSPMGLAHAVEGRALVALAADRRADAAPFLAEAVELFGSVGNLGCTAHVLEAVAVWASSGGDAETGAELVGAAESLRLAGGHGHRPWEVRARLGVDFAEAGFGGPAYDRGRVHGETSALALAAAVLRSGLSHTIGR